MSRPTARESVALMAGYHSPQIDVDVRLNTNESPEPPPEGFTDAVAAPPSSSRPMHCTVISAASPAPR